jgi:hypothetical protein
MSERFAQQRNDRGGWQRVRVVKVVGMNHGDGLIKRSGSSNIPSLSLSLSLPLFVVLFPTRISKEGETRGSKPCFLSPDHQRDKEEMTDSLS